MIIIKKIENTDVFGIDLEIQNRGTTGSNFSEIRRDPGFISFENNITEFTLPELTEVDNNLVLYSKTVRFDIEPLFKNNSDITSVQELITFYMELKKKNLALPKFSLNMFYKIKGGGILMMPPSIVEFVNNKEALEKRLNEVSIYRHPDLDGEKSILYSIGILLYSITTNSYPIKYSDVEDLRDKMRRGKLVQPRWRNINISEKTNSLISNLLDIKTTTTLSLSFDNLNKIMELGLYREEGDYSKEAKINMQKEINLLNSEARRTFIIKHKALLTGCGIGLIILISFFGTIINNALKPPATTGFTSHQVVEGYFESFQTFNPELIDDILRKGVRKNDSTEISTMYVTSKMRMQSDPNLKIINPKEWLMLDDKLKLTTDVYGIYNLQIEELEENKFKVSYEKWYTQADDGDMTMEIVLRAYKLNRVEIFTLEETKYSFEIIDIETRLETSERVW